LEASSWSGSQGFLQSILDSLTDDGVIVADNEGRFVLFNPAAERILGLGALAARGAERTVTSSCFLEDRATPFPPDRLPIARAIRGEAVDDCPIYICNRAVPGGGVWISANSAPLKDEQGTIRGGIVVFRDITQRRKRTERIQLLSAAVEQTADTVIVTNKDGIIEYVNPAVEKVTGYSEAEVIGETPRVFRSGAHAPTFYRAIWTTLMDGRVHRGTILNRKKNGELYYSEQTIAPIREPGGAISHFVSVGKDVTELRKAAEREGKLLLARAVQQKLLPVAPPCTPGFDIAGAAFTADETGGDYFDFIPLPDGRLGLVIADASGHGFDAALVMAQTHAYVRSAVLTCRDPARALEQVNRFLTEGTADNRFVTLLLAFLDARRRDLHYASAGHTTGYVLGASGAIRCELPSTGMPLGLFVGAGFETATTRTLEDDDVLVLFTDGVVETGPSVDEAFGSTRALEVIHEHRHEPAARMVQHLRDAISTFSGSLQADDITVVICKVTRREE
jgi:phosphoserine phosphatase RsbU/P